MSSNAKTVQDAKIPDDRTVTRALRNAVREALRTHALLGHHVIIWRNGKIARVPAKSLIKANAKSRKRR